ncbi:MAG: FUSC family protein [Gordonia sp. (in: high G+C Gram-positive bacteria)]|uniref:FUSC family protein n=1 Tax=Gordonia sp. (in: high G+C Gram-positive bacteria) TaxID=84139 RepID=UPI0039E57DD2
MTTARIRERRSRVLGRLPAPVAGRLRRLGLSLVPILQCAIAGGVAWFVAFDLLGHKAPFFAPIAAVSSLGLVLARRWRRSIELISGVLIGIVVGDLVISLIGSGPWQIAVVVALAMAVAVAADGAPMMTTQAGASAVLVATLLPPGNAAGYERAVDAIIGGVVALVIGALIPVNPAHRARRDAALVLETLRDLSGRLAEALRLGDTDDVQVVLDAARGTQTEIDAMHADMRAGREVVTLSPLFWSERPRLGVISATAAPIDRAMRNFRVCARRAHGLCRRGIAVEPAVIDLIAALPEGFEVLREMMLAPPKGHPDQADAATVLRSIVRRARPAINDARAALDDGDGDVAEIALLVELRSLLVDMLMVAGLQRESAIAQLRLDAS